jgi:hypothetical protein
LHAQMTQLEIYSFVPSVSVDVSLVAAQPSRSGYPRIVDAPKEAVAAKVTEKDRVGYELQDWNYAPTSVTRGKKPIAVIGELGPETVASLTKGVPNLGPRLSVVSAKGETLAHLGTEKSLACLVRTMLRHDPLLD